MSGVTVWSVEAQLRKLATDPGNAANDHTLALVLLAELKGQPYVTPGETLDSILDSYLAIRDRALATP